MINAARSHRNLLISLLATVTIHIILLFFSSQIFLSNNENDAEFTPDQRMIIEFKFIGDENSRAENKVFMQSNAPTSKKIRNTLSPENVKTVKTFKFQGNQSFKRMLPQMLQNTSLAQSNSSFSLEIPKGVPEDELNEFQQMLYSFYLRLQGQYVSTLADKYLELQRLNPNFQIPINREKDRVLIRATYDLGGNIVRIRTVQSARFKDHSEFFLKAIRGIETIPNPPKILLDKNEQFHVNYDLILNPRF